MEEKDNYAGDYFPFTKEIEKSKRELTENIFETNKTYFGDCLEVMKIIPDSAIDCVICDTPYGGQTHASWDIQLDLPKMWEHLERVVKPNGAILLFAKTPFDKILGASNLKLLKYEWIWEKAQATGHFNAKKMPMQSHENILVYARKPPIYNPQKTQGHKPINSYTKRADVANKSEVYGKVTVDISGGGETDRYPRSVLRFPSDKQKNKLNGTIHPTQKPLALCEYLIRTYTNPGDVVLDFCSGSGTTGLAAKNLDRKYIMIENDVKWYELSKARVGEK